MIQGDKLRTFRVFDYESDSIYSIRIQTDDQNGGVFSDSFEVKVIDLEDVVPNNAPTDILLSNSRIQENQNIGTTIGVISGVDVDGNDTLLYSLATGNGDDDNRRFVIQGNQLKSFVVFDYEADSVHSILVRVDDQKGGFFQKVFEIKVSDVFESTETNQPPSGLLLSNDSVFENANIGSVVGRFSSIDPNGGDVHTYQFVSGLGDNDNFRFVIKGDTLKTFEVFDFETDSLLSIRVATEDSAGSTFSKSFLIHIKDVVEMIFTNDAPTNIALSSISIAEDALIGSTIGTLSSQDPNGGDTHTYEFVSGAGDDDNASFVIQGDQLKSFVQFDYETDSVYNVRIKTEDQDGAVFIKSFVIAITDVVEVVNNPPFGYSDFQFVYCREQQHRVCDWKFEQHRFGWWRYSFLLVDHWCG